MKKKKRKRKKEKDVPNAILEIQVEVVWLSFSSKIVIFLKVVIDSFVRYDYCKEYIERKH